MPDMKLNAEVLLRIEGHDELYSIGTIDVPINVTFGDKPIRPGMREALVTNFKVDEGALKRNVESAVKRGSIRP